MICELTELDVEFCGHCRQKAPRTVFTAQFDSICPTCSLALEKGQQAVWTLDGSAAEHVRHAR